MKLIINADDFGLCSSVNRAILDAYAAGNLTSTTLMVSMPGTAEAVRLAKENPGLGVGLHFTLTEGRPLTGAKTLTDENGVFLKRYDLIRHIYSGRVQAAEIAEEFSAQLARMTDAGLKPTHFDSHQHVHMVPAVFKAILPIATSHTLPMRITVPNAEPGLIFRRPVKWLKQAVLQAAQTRLRREISTGHNTELVSIHDLGVDLTTVGPGVFDSLLQKHAAGAGVVELMVHPYRDEPDVYALYESDVESHLPFFKKCFLEHRLLTARANLFSAYNLINYGAL